MLRIRLTRIGKRNQPSFRIVLAEHWRPIKGKFIEILGYYNPRTKVIKLKKERLKYWLSKGAHSSDTVHNLLVSQNLIVDKKRKKHIIKKKKALKKSGQGGPAEKVEKPEKKISKKGKTEIHG